MVRFMNKLSRAQRAHIISLLVEGMSLRAVTRTTGASINTVTKLLVDAGRACSDYQDKALRDILQAASNRRDLGVLLRQG